MPYEYDRRGFDMEGVNIFTGTKYGPDGFDVNGLNYEGKSREEIEAEDDDPHR